MIMFLRLAALAVLAVAAFAQPSPTQIGQQFVGVTIADGATTSSEVLVGACTPVAVVTPSALTSTTITFTASHDGTTFSPMYDIYGTAVSATVGTSRWVVLQPADWYGVYKFKIVAGTVEGAARTLQVVCRAR